MTANGENTLPREINVTMTLDAYERLQRQIAEENHLLGRHAGEGQLIDFLTRVAKGEIGASDVDYAKIPPSHRAACQRLVRLVELACVADAVQRDALMTLPSVKRDLTHVDGLGLAELDAWINAAKPDTVAEALVYDRAVKRQSNLRKKLTNG